MYGYAKPCSAATMEDQLLQQQPSQETLHFSAEGMGKVVTSVSGYPETERLRLMWLIVGSWDYESVEYPFGLFNLHSLVWIFYLVEFVLCFFIFLKNFLEVIEFKIVCERLVHVLLDDHVTWNFERTKYDLAKRLGKIIVNHRWIEDCIKQGRRIEEEPYTSQSGKEVGPLFFEPQPREMYNWLSDLSDSHDSEEPNLLPDLGTSNNRSGKSKKKKLRKVQGIAPVANILLRSLYPAEIK